MGFRSIDRGTTSEGVLRSRSRVFAEALARYDGKKMKLRHGLYEAPGGMPLVTLGGVALISERRFGRSRILYLHFLPLAHREGTGNAALETVEPSVQDGAFERDLLDATLLYAGHRPSAVAPPGIHVLTFDRSDRGTVCVIFNGAARNQVRRGGEVFRCYQARDPSVAGEARVLVGRRRSSYTITDMITGGSAAERSDAEGYLAIDFTGWNLRGVYIDPR